MYALSILRPCLPPLCTLPPPTGSLFVRHGGINVGNLKMSRHIFLNLAPNPHPWPHPPSPRETSSIPIELPLNSSSFFSYCGLDVQKKREKSVEEFQEWSWSCVYGYDKESELKKSLLQVPEQEPRTVFFFTKRRRRKKDCSRSLRGRVVLKGPKEVFTESILKREYM